MQDFHCPTCGRWLAASDAPPGYKVRVPPCRECKSATVFKTERTYPAALAPVARIRSR